MRISDRLLYFALPLEIAETKNREVNSSMVLGMILYEGVDLALFTDGLKDEREQGITIDVAYRYFSTARRKFIIADTPGHEQYTRNMATGASTCDLAVILIDARHGVMTQTRRHSYIVSLLGIRHVVVAVNKMDLVDWAEGRFTEIEADYLEFARKIGVADPHVMPISALAGDNVVEPSVHMSWFDGIPMMEYLETVEVAQDRNVSNFRFPVQIVIRPDLSFRGYAGTITSGVVRTGDEVVVLPSGKRSMVHQIVTADGNLDEAWCGQAVTITLADELDVSRGDMLVHTDDRPRVSNQIDTMLVWMSEDPMVTGKQYLVRQASKVSNGVVRTLYDKVDVDTLVSETAQTLELNEIGRVSVVADQPLLWDPYETNRSTGAFILIDRSRLFMFPEKFPRFTVKRHGNHACVFGIGTGHKYRITPDNRCRGAGSRKIDTPAHIFRLTPLNR